LSLIFLSLICKVLGFEFRGWGLGFLVLGFRVKVRAMGFWF
jgi:hypothetical protein